MNESKAISETKTPRVPAGCVVLFGMIFLLAGMAGFWFSVLNPALRCFQARSWPETQATISKSEVAISSDSDGTSYKPVVHFTYVVNGQLQVSESWSFAVWSATRKWAEGVVARYPPGSKHACYYNPGNPSDGVLDRTFPWINLIGSFLLAFVAVGAGIIWFGFQNRRNAPIAGARGGNRWNEPAKTMKRNDTLRIGEQDPSGRETPWQALEGPQRLKPAISRMAKFLGVLLLALIWNGITWAVFIQILGAEGWFSISAMFITVFVIAGAGLAVLTLYMFLCLFNPVISVALSNGAVPIGEGVDIAWETSGNYGRIAELKIDMVGQEKATYTRGTSTYTENREFARIEVTRTRDPITIQFGSLSLQIPPDTMHSFAGSKNKIEWSIEVHGVIHKWPDVKESMPFAVKPARLTSLAEEPRT